MIERLRPHRSGAQAARRRAPRPQGARRRSGSPPPLPPPPAAYGVDEATILGLPAETGPDTADDVGTGEPTGEVERGPAVPLVVLRRSDFLAGSLLVLAGVAANVSLWLPWVDGDTRTGISLVRRGFGALRSGWTDLLLGGVWQPVAIVVGGGALVLLGALMFVPAHSHRLVGVLALLVALAAAAAVLSLIAGADWIAERFGPGMWAGVAVAALGLLGALKAMLTLPRVTAREDDG